MNQLKMDRVKKNQTIEIQDIPRSLVVPDFVEAREFEIQAMEKVIQNASQFTGNVRVFQLVKRHMRRRAASVNIKRLPRNMRQRALTQMARDPAGVAKITRRKKRRQSEYRHSPTWLQTHIWHAKRMKMKLKWGLALAMHPNQKGIRFAYKSTKNEAIMNDISYYRVLQLQGPIKDIVEIFDLISDPFAPSIGSGYYINGSRQGHLFLHEPHQFPNQSITKIQFLWNKQCLWLWIHNDSYEKVYLLLYDLICKRYNLLMEQDKKVEKVDLNGISLDPIQQELIRFEFRGPRSHAILSHCLTLASKDINETAHELWKKCSHISSSAVFPPGVVIGLLIEDPRVCFPKLMPKRMNINDSLMESKDVTEYMTNWPNVSQSNIWNPEIRNQPKQATYSQINSRRSQNLIPGTLLEPLETDSKIPILLISRKQLSDQNNNISSQSSIHGWDLVAPSTWAMSLLHLFNYAGIRVGGIREKQMAQFEFGIPSFPHDYPETATCIFELLEKQKELQKKYNNTPKSKRYSFEQHGIQEPFRPLFETLIPNCIRDEPIQVIHSQRFIAIIESSLQEKRATFEDFVTDIVQKAKIMLHKRNVLPQLMNLDVFNVSRMFIRCDVVLDIGRIQPISRIHFDDASNRDLDSIVNSEFIIGYTLTSGYSFSQGKSRGIGCCTLKSMYQIYKHDKVVCIRGPTGRKSYPARVSIIS